MRFFAILLVMLVAANTAHAQAISYNQPAQALKTKQVLLHDFAFDLSFEQRANLLLAWPNLNFDRKVDAQALRDSSLLIAQVEAVDQKQQRIVVYKGSKALVPAKSGSIPKGAVVLACVTVDQASIKPELTPTYILALRDMLEMGATFTSDRHALAMNSNEEWLSREKPIYIDSLHLAEFFRSPEGWKKLDVENVTFANHTDLGTILGTTEDAAIKGVWVTRQLVTYGKQDYVQTYIFNLNRGLQFFVEEPRVKYGSFEIAKTYLTYLFRPDRGEPIKDPDLLNKAGFAVQRQF